MTTDQGIAGKEEKRGKTPQKSGLCKKNDGHQKDKWMERGKSG